MNDRRIKEGIIPPLLRRRLKAALTLLALRQKDFAAKEDLDMYRVSRMLNGKEPAPEVYVEAFNDLLDSAQDALDEDRLPQPAAA